MVAIPMVPYVRRVQKRTVALAFIALGVLAVLWLTIHPASQVQVRQQSPIALTTTTLRET